MAHSRAKLVAGERLYYDLQRRKSVTRFFMKSVSLIDGRYSLDNINLAPPGSYDGSAIDARGTTDGEFSVGGHGASGGGVVDQRSGQNSFPTPSQLANEISNHPDYSPGMPVRLNACQAGQGTYAQTLANLLGSRVTAPLSNLYTAVWPPSFIGDPSKVLFDLARWKDFEPEKCQK